MKNYAVKLRAMAAGIEDALAEAVIASVGRGAELARSLAPVESGALRDGITVRTAGAGIAEVVSTAAHSAMVEYGTSRAPAQPFLLPAARQMHAEFVRDAIRAAQEVLK